MDKRTKYVEELSAQMVEWDTQIEQLKDKAKSAPPQAEFNHSDAIAALQSYFGAAPGAALGAGLVMISRIAT